VGPSLPTMQ